MPTIEDKPCSLCGMTMPGRAVWVAALARVVKVHDCPACDQLPAFKFPDPRFDRITFK